MLGHIDALTVLTFLVGLEFPVEGLEASQKMRYAAIGPKAFHPDVGTGIGLCVGSLVAESFSGQGLKRWSQFNITVHLFHALCKERGGVVVAQVNESLQLAYLFDLCMVDSMEPQGQVGGRLSSGQQ